MGDEISYSNQLSAVYEDLGKMGAIMIDPVTGALHFSAGMKKILHLDDFTELEQLPQLFDYLNLHGAHLPSKDISVWPAEMEICLNNGSKRRFKCFKTSAIDHTETIIFRDITRKRSGADINSNKVLLQTILDMSPSGILLLRPITGKGGEVIDFRFILSNRSGDKINETELLGKTYHEVFKGSISEELFRNYVHILNSCEIMDREDFLPDHAGGKWFRFMAGRMNNDVLVSYEDITTRKASEEGLRRTSIQLQAIFAGSHVQISYLKPIRDEEEEIVDFSLEIFNKLEWQTRRSRKGTRSQLLSELLPHVRNHELFQKLVQVLQDHKTQHFETYYALDGLNTWLDVSFVYYEDGVISSSVNITDMKNATLRLEESKNLLESVLNASLSGIIFYRSVRDEKGKIVNFETLVANAAAWQFMNSYGITSQQMLEQFPGLDREGLFNEFVDVVEQNKELDDEMFYQDDRVDMWVHRRAVKLEDGIVLCWEDVSERKLQDIMIREQLREITESQELLNSVFDASLNGIIVFKNIMKGKTLVDVEIVLYNTNKHFPGIEPATGKKLLADEPNECGQRLFNILKTVNDSLKTLQTELYFNHTQTETWIQLTAASIPGGIVITYDDITDRKLAESRLRQQEAGLRSLVENTPDLISRWNRQVELLFSNSAFDELMAQSHQTIFGKTTQQLGFDSGMVFPDEHAIREVFANGLHKDHFNTLILPNETVHLYSILVPETDASGNIDSVLCIARDITEIKHVEDELKDHNQKLMESRQSLQRKDHFIRIASHELKTPITAMYGYVQILMEKYQFTRDNFLGSSLGVIHKQVVKLNKLITELLDITKVDTNSLKMHPEVFDMSELIRDTLDFLQASHRHQLLLESVSTDAHVFADKERVSQVLVNLVTNAIKYSPKANQILVAIKADEDDVTVGVKDYGIGISFEHHKKIFERFYRVEGKKEETFAGFGIGLYIVAEIIERHKGKVWLESAPGKGSTFYFSLPKSPPNE